MMNRRAFLGPLVGLSLVLSLGVLACGSADAAAEGGESLVAVTTSPSTVPITATASTTMTPGTAPSTSSTTTATTAPATTATTLGKPPADTSSTGPTLGPPPVSSTSLVFTTQPTFTVVTSDGWTNYEEDDPNMTWTGPWVVSQTSGSSGGACKVIPSAGSVSMNFEGVKIEPQFLMSSSSGIARIFVDGQEVTTVDLYGKYLYFDSPWMGLFWNEPGKHTLRIEWTGLKNAEALGSIVALDRVAVWKGKLLK